MYWIISTIAFFIAAAFVKNFINGVILRPIIERNKIVDSKLEEILKAVKHDHNYNADKFFTLKRTIEDLKEELKIIS